MRNLNDSRQVICERAEIADMRLHDRRHSFASRVPAPGEGLPTIGRLPGHAQVETAARYAHLAQDSVREGNTRPRLPPRDTLLHAVARRVYEAKWMLAGRQSVPVARGGAGERPAAGKKRETAAR